MCNNSRSWGRILSYYTHELNDIVKEDELEKMCDIFHHSNAVKGKCLSVLTALLTLVLTHLLPTFAKVFHLYLLIYFTYSTIVRLFA
jgi:hypothetical protein